MQSPRNSEEDVRFPGAGAIGACELSNMDMSAGLNPGSLQEQNMLLTPESYLQPHPCNFNMK